MVGKSLYWLINLDCLTIEYYRMHNFLKVIEVEKKATYFSLRKGKKDRPPRNLRLKGIFSALEVK